MIIDQKAPPQEQLTRRPRRVMSLLSQYRELASALAFFVLMMLVFTIASPSVWLNSLSYTAVFISLPIYITLAVSLVFVVVAGEIDLSFASVVGVAAMVFSEFVLAGWNPYLCLVLAMLAGGVAGLINGLLVAYFGLSSLIVTPGMNFFWRGFIQIVTNGMGAPLAFLQPTSFHNVFVGLASGFVGVLAILINNNFYPTVGDGYLLIVLAAIFVGGTAGMGGVGTVAGAVVGAFTVGFIESGIVAAGLTGYWTQFIYGIVIVLSLVTHRLYSPHYKK